MPAEHFDDRAIFQVAFVTNDIEKTKKWCAEFFDMKLPETIVTGPRSETEGEYLGAPSDARAKLAFFNFGNTTLELTYMGLNHSDSTIVMSLPREKIIFTVDVIPVGGFLGRGMIDSYPLEWEEFLKKVIAMDWERLIPGHPGAGGRLGTKQDAQDILALLQHASAEVKTAAQEGKCWDTVEKELKLPKYASWPGYEAGLPFVLRRYCGLWGRGT